MDNNNHKCVLMTDKNHRILYTRAGAFYQNLINKGEEVDLARDNTNKWAATNNQDINGKYFLCWCSYSFYLIIIVLLNSY